MASKTQSPSRWDYRGLTVGFAGYDVYDRDGYEFRLYHKKFESYANSIKVTPRAGECFEIPYAYKKDGDWFCNLGEKSQPVKFFAHGDSHALGLLPALENFAKDYAVNIQFTGASGCPSLLGIQSMRGEIGIEKFNCKELNERVFRHVRDSGIKSVILINRWVYYTESKSRPNEFNPVARNIESSINVESSTNDVLWALKYTVERYKSIGVNVVFIQDNPQQIHEPKDILRKGNGVDGLYNLYSVGYEEHVRNQERVNAAIRQQEADIVSFDSVLCDAKHCPLVRASRFLYSDDDHLSIDGANYVYPLLSKALSK